MKCATYTLGHFNSHGISAMTSTASAPPTPINNPPRPPINHLMNIVRIELTWGLGRLTIPQMLPWIHYVLTSIRRMTVCANQECTRKSIVLKNNLMYDATSWFPKTDAILCRCSAQEAINLTIDVFCLCKILTCTNLSLDKMITVDGGRNSNLTNEGLL